MTYLRGNDDLLFMEPADMWTSGAEMLPVLLDELKSASLPGKEKGGINLTEILSQRLMYVIQASL